MKKPIISISIILLAVFLLSYFVLLDKYDQVKSLRFGIEQKNNDFNNLENYFKDLSTANENLIEYESETEKIYSAIPQNLDLPSLFDYIQKTVKENKLVLGSLSSGQSLKKSPVVSQQTEQISNIKETNISLSVSGSYSDFKNFLSVLEKSARIISVEDISFSSSSFSSSLESSLIYNLSLKVYSR